MIDIRIKNVSERAKDFFRFVNPLTLGFSLTFCALKYLTFLNHEVSSSFVYIALSV